MVPLSLELMFRKLHTLSSFSPLTFWVPTCFPILSRPSLFVDSRLLEWVLGCTASFSPWHSSNKTIQNSTTLSLSTPLLHSSGCPMTRPHREFTPPETHDALLTIFCPQWTRKLHTEPTCILLLSAAVVLWRKGQVMPSLQASFFFL